MASRGSSRELKYQRIANDLKEAIQAGRYGPGDRLPGENELMATYQVARMTARQALGVLINEGAAESRKGAGVFLREFRPVRRRGIQRLSSQQWGTGRSIWAADVEDRPLAVDQVEVSEESASERIASALMVDPETLVCIRKRRYVVEGKPVALATSYLPADITAGTAITQENPGPGGIYARLADLGYKPVHFREEVRCRMPSESEAKQLSLSTGVPIILVCRTAFAEGGRPVEVNEMCLDSASYLLEYDWDA